MLHRVQEDQTRADWLIPDPGDAGAIDNRYSGVCELTDGADAETRKLGPPCHRGQWLFLVHNTAGGGGITLSTYKADLSTALALNVTGENTVTFDAAGECLFLIGAMVGTQMRWFTVAGYEDVESEGASLSTV